MLPAAALVMLHLAVGPFAHPSLLHWHQRWQRLSALWRHPLLLLACVVLVFGTLELFGWSS